MAQKAYQCGPAALTGVYRYWGQEVNPQTIGQQLYQPGTRGVFNFMLNHHAREAGYWTQMEASDLESLKRWLRRGIPPIVMLRVGPRWIPTYHFILLKGFHDPDRFFYANTGDRQTKAIGYQDLEKRWEEAARWTLLISPLEQVNWRLPPNQASDLAFRLEKKGRLDLAEQWYRLVLEQELGSPAVRFNLGNICLKTGRLEEAQNLFQSLVEEQPAEVSYSNNLAWVYLQQGRYQDSIRVIEKAFQQGAERRRDILDTAGWAHYKLKRYAQAQAFFQEAQASLR